MSVMVMALVYKSRLGCVYRKAVALKLGDCANDEGENVWPSVATIAAQAEVSERTVRNKLSELVALGLLEVVRPGGGYGVTTRYRFNLDHLSAVAAGRLMVRETNDGPELVGAENPAPGAPISDPNYPAPGAGFRKTTLQLTSNYPAPGAYEPSYNHPEEVKEASKEKKYTKQYPSLVAAREAKGIGKKTSLIGSEGPEAHDEPGVSAKPAAVKLAVSEAGQVRRFLPKATPPPSASIDRALLRRAEGLGLPLDEMLAATDRAKPNDPDGYFQGLCKRRLKRMLPTASDALLGRALSHDDRAYGTLTSLLVMAGAAS